MNSSRLLLFFLFISYSCFSQGFKIQSPNEKIFVSLQNEKTGTTYKWFLKVIYQQDNHQLVVIPRIDLGLLRNDQAFSTNLKMLKAGKITTIKDAYTAVHGKRLYCTNLATEVVYAFENSENSKLNLILRAYNDGVAFRYEFPG